MKKVLIVDDSALMRRVLFDIINSDGELQAEEYAMNGLEALEILRMESSFFGNCGEKEFASTD